MKKMGLHWGVALAVNWATISAAIALACYINHPVIYVLAVLIVGTRQHALAMLAHDGAHHHIVSNRRLNDAMSSLFCFWPLGMGMHGWRKFHFKHHRTVGTPDDPELGIKQAYPHRWSPKTNQLRQFFLDMLGFSLVESTYLFRLAPPERKIDVLGPLALHVAAWTAVLYLADWRVLAIWYVAFATSFWAMFRLRGFSEHVYATPGNPTPKKSEPPLWQRLLYLSEYTWLHWEHHEWPAVPHRQLREKARRAGFSHVG